MKEKLRLMIVDWLGGMYSEDKADLVSLTRVGPIMVRDLVDRLADFIEVEVLGRPGE